jgi:dienelactone hydrolase
MRRTIVAIACALTFGCGSGDEGTAGATGGFVGATGGVVGSGGVMGSGGVVTASGGTTNAGGAAAGGTPAAGGTTNPTGCGQNLLPLPDDPSQRGPWEVGLRTVTIGRLKVEVVYPAEPGSSAGKPEAFFDIRDYLPDSERAKVPDAASPQVKAIGGHVFRDLPIDGTHGPYPVVVMIHGTASFRIASGSINAHWASHGFVVLTADYPGLCLHDQLANTKACSLPPFGPQDVPGDVKAQIAALSPPAGDLAFLAGHADVTRLGLSGHSQGACLTNMLANLPNVQIVMPLTGSTEVSASSSLKSVLFVAGIDDKVIGFDSVQIGNGVCPANPDAAVSNVAAYDAAAGPPQIKKRIVGIAGGGHLVPTDLCQTNAQGRNAIEEAKLDGVCGIDQAALIGIPKIFDCGTIAMPVGVNAVNYVTTAALEETLHCQDRTKQFADMQAKVPVITDYRHAP